MHTQNRRRCGKQTVNRGGGGQEWNGNLVGEKKLFYSNQIQFSRPLSQKTKTNRRRGCELEEMSVHRSSYASQGKSRKEETEAKEQQTQTSGVWVWKGRDNVLNKGRRTVVGRLSGHHFTPGSSLLALPTNSLPPSYLPSVCLHRAWSLWCSLSKGYLHIPKRREFEYKFPHSGGGRRRCCLWWWW